MDTGCNGPPPMLCKARKKIDASTLQASLQRTVPALKNTRLVAKRFLLATKLVSRPAKGIINV